MREWTAWTACTACTALSLGAAVLRDRCCRPMPRFVVLDDGGVVGTVALGVRSADTFLRSAHETWQALRAADANACVDELTNTIGELSRASGVRVPTSAAALMLLSLVLHLIAVVTQRFITHRIVRAHVRALRKTL